MAKKKPRRKRKAPAVRKPADAATLYAENVLGGKAIACRWVKMACQRHIDDRRRAVFTWDIDAAERINRYFKYVLRLNGGQFEGKPFVLTDFQEFIAGNNFGWKRPDGRRRFRTSYEEIAKGSGKSPFAAGRAMYLFANDKEARAEIYYAGSNKDQAMVAFRDAVAMVDQSPYLTGEIVKSGTGENVWNLAHLPSASWCRPISKERRGKSGPRPHGFVCDELHEHKDGEILNMLRFGFKWRRQPLGIETTNSGTNKLSICWQHHQYGLKILKRAIEDDEFFAFICGLDSCDKCYAEGFDQPKEGCKKCDQYTDEKVWLKANPNLNVIDQWDTLRKHVREAKEMPEQENEVKRLNFCLWTQQITRFIPMDAWHRCAVDFDLAELKGRAAYPGLDLSNQIDVAAMVLVFPPDKIVLQPVPPAEAGNRQQAIGNVGADLRVGPGEGAHTGAPLQNPPNDAIGPAQFTINVDKLEGTFDLVPFLYLPADKLAELAKQSNVPYELWQKQGHIITTPGNVIDYDYIREDLLAQRALYPMKDGGFDPWGATQLATWLNNQKGFELVQIVQTFNGMSEPTKLFLRLILSKKIRYRPNPALTWMADNFRVVRSRRGEAVHPAKDSPTEKIDGIAAAIIGLARAMFHSGLVGTVYASRGVRAI